MTDPVNAVLTRRTMIVGGALALGAAGAWAATPRLVERRLGGTKMGALIPNEIGTWQAVRNDGVVVATDDEGAPVDGYDQVLTRTYQADGLPSIMLLIAYGSTQGGSLQLHRPETCYPGQGFVLREFDEAPFHAASNRAINTRRFTATRDDRIERVFYWTRVADRFPLNTAQLYATILGSVIKGVVPDGILVRFSTIGPDVEQSDRALSAFAMETIAGVAPMARQLLIGAD